MSQYLPILFALICPLMMLFMMSGMHGGKHNRSEDCSTKEEIQALKLQNEILKEELNIVKSKMTN